MDELNMNELLERTEPETQLKNILMSFQENKHDLLLKKGVYIYGEPGIGKTNFVLKILKEMNYDVVKYDAGDVRNKTVIDTITKHNMSDKNIMSMFHKKIKKIAILMDEIDGMNNGDKGGINTLIKLIRPKKTKKQKLEEVTMNPIICIGGYHIDKKIKELMKVCHVIELKTPTSQQLSNIVSNIMPNLDAKLQRNVVDFVHFDLRKLFSIYEIYKNKQSMLKQDILQNIFQSKTFNDDAKTITQKLINTNFSMKDHAVVMNETDRTIVGLLWHENIIDVLSKRDKKTSIPFYLEILHNMCLADYIDRITFQKQIWQFNEMSSLIKTFKNNKLYHTTFQPKTKYQPKEVRFTKVLTKYSTEYNNSLFIQGLCQQLNMDQKDLFSFFLDLRENHDNTEILALLENYDISKLDISRMYRYLDKYIKEDAPDTVDHKYVEEDDCQSVVSDM